MKKNLEPELISKYIPELGISLAKLTGKQFVERIGNDIIKNVVSSTLCGGNVRSLTEGLTQRRISLSHAAMLIAYLKALKNIDNFPRRIPEIVSHELKSTKLSKEKKAFLQWLVGLTGKSIQNVLRSDEKHLEIYLKDLQTSLTNAIEQSKREFGELKATILIDKEEYSLEWNSFLQIFTAIGSQTLAIRGSEKSMYGKLFEKLILGSLLTILGFELINPKESTKSRKVFWLSQRENKRESDATVLLKPGTGIRFDIGFIGPGNSEISLDKVSRFEREWEYGRQLHYMSTIIIVDKIGSNSRIVDLAANINGRIIQMSGSYWVKEICHILKDATGFDHEILKMTNDQSLEYIKKEMQKIDFKYFT